MWVMEVEASINNGLIGYDWIVYLLVMYKPNSRYDFFINVQVKLGFVFLAGATIIVVVVARAKQ